MCSLDIELGRVLCNILRDTCERIVIGLQSLQECLQLSSYEWGDGRQIGTFLLSVHGTRLLPTRHRFRVSASNLTVPPVVHFSALSILSNRSALAELFKNSS